MSVYKYKAADSTGSIREVLIEGDTEADALNRLRSRGFIPLRCLGLASAGGSFTLGRLLGNRGFNVYDFTDRLVPLLKAHIPLERALEIISEGMTEKNGKPTVVALRRGLHEGKKFSELIRSCEPQFPKLYANLVETGEKTGCLPEVMIELQHFLNDSRELREFIITSSIYPLIVLSITFLVIILLFTVFIPRFANIFVEMGKELPLPTAILMNIGNWTIDLWWLWGIIIVALIVVFSRIHREGPVKNWWDKFILKLPIFGALTNAAEMNRFIKTIAILIKNHVGLLETVDIGKRVIQNNSVRTTFSDLAHELRSGSGLSEALKKSSYMPVEALQMLKVGEESGQMGEMLGEASEELERRMKVKIKRLLALFEPAVILFLASIITLVIISIFMAILEMNEIN